MTCLMNWILMAAACLGLVVIAAAADVGGRIQEDELILVASRGESLVTVLIADSHNTHQVVRVEAGPTGLVLAKDGGIVAVLHGGASSADHSVTFFSLQLERVLRVVTLEGVSRPSSGAFEFDGAHLLIAVQNGTSLYRISVKTGIAQPLLDLGEMGASQVLVAPDGKTAWASFAQSGTLVVCDLLQGRVTSRIPLGGGTSNIALHPGGRELWATNALTNSISIVDLESQREVIEFPVGSEPWDLAFTPDGNSVLVVHRHGASATLLDTKHRTVRGEVRLGESSHQELGGKTEPAVIGVLPTSVAMGLNGLRAYVTCEGTGELLTLALAPLSVENRMIVGRSLSTVCVAQGPTRTP